MTFRPFRRVSVPIAALVLCCALTSDPAKAQQSSEGVQQSVLTANQVVFDTERNTVTAEGKVELSRDGRRLLADRLTYDQSGDRVFAEGNVVLLEQTGEAFFASSLEITGDLREGTIQGFKALLGEQIRLAAARGTRAEGARNVLDKAVYSPCPLCAGKGPLWQIKADRVIWDQSTKTVTYRNAIFELFGVPIGYLPYFSHPDPTVEQKTGVLAPTFGTSSTLGYTVETPFYVALAPNRDLTITPLFTTNAGPLLGLQARDRQTFGETMLQTSFTYTDPSDTEDQNRSGKTFRGHIRGEGRYQVSEKWTSGFDLFLTTDNTYLDRYDISGQNLLTNDVYVNRIAGGDFIGISGLGFQGLREGDDQGSFPIVLPLIESRLRSSLLPWGSRLTLDSSLVALTRTDGLDTRRLSSEIGWQVPGVGPIGDLLRLRVSLRGDAYNYDGNPQTFSSDDMSGSEGRVIPRATFDWSWPLVGDTAGLQYYLEPTVMMTAAPYNLNDRSIPNEDSQQFEFDETNLFSPDRFTGLDRVDEGARVAYGVRFGSLSGGPLDISGVFGQSWQPRETDDFPADSGVNSNFSDFVGRLDLRPSDYFNIRYRFRADRTNLQLRRNDIKLSLGPPNYRLDLSYIELTDEQNDFSSRSREEAGIGVRLQPFETLAIGAQMRRDLSRNRQVTNMVGVLYTHPCFELLAGLEQSFTDQGELDDEITFKVRVTLVTLGSLQGGT
jgi:LPS-assembly protein